MSCFSVEIGGGRMGLEYQYINTNVGISIDRYLLDGINTSNYYYTVDSLNTYLSVIVNLPVCEFFLDQSDMFNAVIQ